MLSVRPKIAELSLQLYGRSLHPELFEVCSEKRVQRGRVDPPGADPMADSGAKTGASTLSWGRETNAYEATVQITSAGHVVAWRCGGLTLTEVCASSHQPLPLKRRLMRHRLEADRSDRVECRGGVTYDVDFTLETATPEAFRAYQQEFDLMSLQGGALEEGGGGLLYRFEASGRVGVKLGAISYIDVQSRDRALRVRALHTFPDDCAIVKTESVFRLPG